MEGEFMQLLKQGNYSELLRRSLDVLASSPGDCLALAFEGRALASLQRYEDASNVLKQVIRLSPSTNKRLASIRELEKYCRRLSSFRPKYTSYTRRLAAWADDWYAARLRAEVARQDGEANGQGYESKKTQLQEEMYRVGEVFIINSDGPLSLFQGVDDGVYRGLSESMMDFPMEQCDNDHYVYLKSQTYRLNYKRRKSRYYYREGPEPAAAFPTVKWEDVGTVTQYSPECDVFASTDSVNKTTQRLLQWSLNKVATQRQDYFVPMYQNIIDPNLSAMKNSTGTYVWTATDFLIEEIRIPKIETVVALQGAVRRAIGRGLPWHSADLILSFVNCHLVFGKANLAAPLPLLPLEDNTELAVAIESVLTAALPLIARLHRPALLLPGRLQAVVKAQSIYLHPGKEYAGVWHSDGLNEKIVAVAIYYYQYSPEMEGGDLEFMSRRPRKEEFWLGGDCSPNSLTPEEAKDYVRESPHCRVPLKQGTLVVFSNYQFIHRVLTMRNSTSSVATRDFLVLFIVDQRAPLESTSKLMADPTNVASDSTRKALFFEQLEPKGKFGAHNESTYSTGNGSVALLGWMEKNEYEANVERENLDRTGFKYLQAMSKVPPLGRGMSWAFEEEAVEKEAMEDEEEFAEEAL